MTYEASPAPGWYPDPGASATLRWWDGVRWGEQAASVPSPYAARGRRPLEPGAPVYTVWIWLVVTLPVLPGALLFLIHPQVLFREIPGTTRLTIPDPFALIGGPMFFILVGLGWLIDAAVVVFSWLDSRELARRGVERPFHWAWSFLGMVYPIGRSVVVRGVAGGRGLAPIWVTVAVGAVSVLLSSVWVIRMVSEIVGTAVQNVPVGA